MISQEKVVIGLLFSVLATGCASVPKEAGFGDVQKAVADRTGHTVQWRGRTAQDAAVDAAVKSLLDRDLTADAAVQVALLNNMNLQATYQDLGVAQADLVQAGLLQNPTLHIERRLPGQAAEIDVLQEFLSVFLIPLRKQIAGTQFEAAKRRVGQAAIDTAAETRSAFYMLQGAQQMLEMRRSVLEGAEAIADASRRIHEAGNSTDLEFENDFKLLAQAKLELAAAEAEEVQDRERLNILMGLWGLQTTWKMSEHLPALPPSDVTPQGLESRAITQRLDLAAERKDIQATAQSLGLAQTARYIPTLTLGGHYEHEINADHSTGPAIEFGIPLFDQGQAVIARGQSLVAQAQSRYIAMAIEVRSRVRAAYQRMIVARDRAMYYQRVVLPLYARILDQTQLQYNGMFLGPIQLLQARQAQIDAGREYIDAMRDFWTARSDLEKEVGGRLPGAMHSGDQPATQPFMPAPGMGDMKMPGMNMEQKPGMQMPGMQMPATISESPTKPSNAPPSAHHHHTGD